MQESLHISPKAWGWVTSVFFLSYGLFEIPTGALGDRIGPRRVLTRIVLWWSTFTSLTGFAASYPLLLLVRFCFGAGEAGAYPNASVVIGRWIPARTRARALVLRFRADLTQFRVGGAGLLVRAIAEPPVPDTRPYGLPWAEALRCPSLWYMTGISMCYVYVFGFYQGWLQAYLVRAHGFTSAALMLSSVPYAAGACANVLGGLASDWAAHRFGLRAGRRVVGVAGLSIAVVFLVATIFTTSGTLALVCLSLSYVGILAQQPNLCALPLDVGRRHAGAIFGFGNMPSQLASFVSSVAFGYIAEYFGNYNAAFVPMVLTLSIGIVLWTRMDAEREIFADSSALDVRSQALGIPTA